MTLLHVEGLRSGYGKLPVLHGLDLHVQADEIVAVVGPNGAGKSTLLKTVFQLLKPMAGTVSFAGRDLAAAGTADLAALGMGYVPQGGSTFPALTVEENLRVALTAVGSSNVTAGLDLAYELFPVLGDRRRQSASTLSGGERQMLALAGAMVIEPRLLALDEPTTGLAPTIVQGLISKITEFRERGSAILWVIEENPTEILPFCDRVYLMQGGVFHREMAASELLDQEALEELFLGADAGGEPADNPAT